MTQSGHSLFCTSHHTCYVANDVDVLASTPSPPECASGDCQTSTLSSQHSHGLSRAENYLESTMKLSARNQIKGKILDVRKGATTAHVRVEIAPGQVITSSITNEAVEDLGLKVGDAAIVVIKASDVMIAVT
jgi:molybdopterin-binding protein